MPKLPAEYLIDIARQLASVSAFLGGFAATFLATLIYAGTGTNARPIQHRIGGFLVVASALSACAFFVAVLALTSLQIGLNPSAPSNLVRESQLMQARVIGLLSFLLGVYALLFAIGASGWLRSRKTGVITAAIAGISAVFATMTLVSGS